MSLNKGFLKMMHTFPYSQDASFNTKCKVIYDTLKRAKENGYDGVVCNVDYVNGYIANKENWELIEKKAKACEELGLRMWVYDESGYPSGAAGITTLTQKPETEALALTAVYKVLESGETGIIEIPYGHLNNMGAVAFYFDGDSVFGDDLKEELCEIPYLKNGYYFENKSSKRMLCIAFFTKYAFEGTHCQHNASSERRYIDIGNVEAGKTFIKNTYKPYIKRLKKYIDNGTIESFFADEPSYMAVYFNLKKKPRTTTHRPDSDIPLWAMVNWSKNLPKLFFERYGYRIENNLAWLFLGNEEHHKNVRRDFYLLLTELAENSFFKPVSDCCQNGNVAFSGHILLEERITDHPRYQGNYFSLLRNMHIPGMDMLDSLPERVWRKSFTPLLVSSISKLYRSGEVMDEVSCHFQNKFGIKVSPEQLLNSLVMQYCFGANIFTSYYDDLSDAILSKIPTGESVLTAFKRIINSAQQKNTAEIAIHYPIEDIMANTVSPVDIARVYDSTLNEFNIPYPINRADLDKDDIFTPIIENNNFDVSKEIENGMEQCMFALLDKQIPFIFCDTSSIEKLIEKSPKWFIIPPQKPEKELLENISILSQNGCKIAVITNNGKYTDYYSGLNDIVLCNDIYDLEEVVNNKTFVRTSGDTQKVAALWSESTLLLVNSEERAKKVTVEIDADSVIDCYSNKSVDFMRENGKITFELKPYGIFLVE